MSSLQADPQHNTEREGSLRGRCQRRKPAPLATPLPPALIPELWTGFWHADVSADPPFTSAGAVGEGMQKWHDPVTHPMATTHLTAGSSRVQQPETAQTEPHTHRQQPPASPPKPWQAALSRKPGGTSWKSPEDELSVLHATVLLASSGPSSSSPAARIHGLPSCPSVHFPRMSLHTWRVATSPAGEK